MTAISNMLKQQVETKGWLSLGNVYFDNGLAIHPHLTNGYVALSPSKNIVVNLQKLDTSTTDAVEKRFVIMDNQYVGFQQTLAILDADLIQHFDLLLYSHERLYTGKKDKFPVPTIPNRSTMLGYTFTKKAHENDEEPTLVAGIDEATLMSGQIVSAVDLYPDNPLDEYSGLRVDAYQEWEQNHKKFINAVKTFTGLTDCI